MKGFTLVEVAVATFIFITSFVIMFEIYVNLTKASLYTQELQLALDNMRFGVEKIWIEIKTGANFVTTTDGIIFKDKFCATTTIKKINDELFFEKNGVTSTIFDSKLVKVDNFTLSYDNFSGGSEYYKNNSKIFIINYELKLITKNNSIPYYFRQGIAPLESTRMSSLCQ